MNNYKLSHFEKAKRKEKKYDAVLVNSSGKQRRVPFGGIKADGNPYEQYRDRTGLGLYSKYDHGDTARKKRYHERHAKEEGKKYSPSWFSRKFLWT